MRPLFVLPALVLLTACSAPRLSRPEAETALKALYPVDLSVDVASEDRAIRGSAQHARLVAFREHLTRLGFTVQREVKEDWETFKFQAPSSMPAGVTARGGGFQVTVGKAEFVKALKMEPGKKSARVTYQVRLVQPTAHFPLFHQLHPTVKAGATRERHAQFRLEGRTWKIVETDEKGDR